MDRDQAILNHLRRYRLSVREVLEHLFFFEGRSSKNVINRLTGDGRVQLVKQALSGNKSYYYPSGSKAPGGDNLWRDLKILYFCCFGPKPRHRLLDDELASLFGTSKPSEDHCLAETDNGFVVLRVYTPDTGIDGALRQIRKHLTDANSNSELRSWIETRQYGFAILGDSIPYCQDILREIEKPQGREPSLQDQAHFHVEYIPAPKPTRQRP